MSTLLERLAELVARLCAEGVPGVRIVRDFLVTAAASAMVQGADEDAFAEAARLAFRKVREAVETPDAGDGTNAR